ncbi:MAG: class I SAM-dependent methyltransferase [Candidatus Pacebacteria bacterium]|nr:class I SAM-dependent methyltransferase [Candidatus Paceibacterota bacterium]
MMLYNKKFSEAANNTPLLRKKLHLKKIIKLLDPQKKDTVLDVGCNKGCLVKILRGLSDEVYGCDINKEAIKNSDIDGLKLISSGDLKYENNFFDKIISSHVIEHIKDLENMMKEIERVLKPNGICVLIYPFEIIRGSNNFIESAIVYKNPLYSRKLHINKLNPKKIQKLTNMKLIRKGLFLGPYPTYYTVFKKIVK